MLFRSFKAIFNDHICVTNLSKLPRNANIIREFTTKHLTNATPFDPYPPDMASCDLFLFPTFETDSSWSPLRAQDAVKENSILTLKGFHKNELKHVLKN
ncbi:hypothetical protein NPIL_502631 [Nephila pilipes]|uniref:Uncharacterized protein n=1 Tax=Nephila pilipes TaxID=299642 RepID=A0A8X6I3B3_NEPPI|nr:hypothetical protein NPIL_502631 [Nephila pilipes]